MAVGILDTLPNRTLNRLQTYVHLLDRWRKITNLISERSFADVWSRHVEDSICIQRACPSAKRWLDIGSGAGFPGIVIAILLAEHGDGQVHCVESDGRKCAFLRTVASELGISAKVHNIRAEYISCSETGRIDAVTARGFSSIEEILDLAQDYLALGASAILPRGKSSGLAVETLGTNRYRVLRRSETGAGTILTIQDSGRTT